MQRVLDGPVWRVPPQPFNEIKRLLPWRGNLDAGTSVLPALIDARSRSNISRKALSARSVKAWMILSWSTLKRPKSTCPTSISLRSAIAGKKLPSISSSENPSDRSPVLAASRVRPSREEISFQEPSPNSESLQRQIRQRFDFPSQDDTPGESSEGQRIGGAGGPPRLGGSFSPMPQRPPSPGAPASSWF